MLFDLKISHSTLPVTPYLDGCVLLGSHCVSLLLSVSHNMCYLHDCMIALLQSVCHTDPSLVSKSVSLHHNMSETISYLFDSVIV